MELDWVSQNSVPKIVLIVLSVCLIGAYAAGSSRPPAQGSASDFELATRIRAYLAPFADSGNSSGVVLVARDGRVLMRESCGMANYEILLSYEGHYQFGPDFFAPDAQFRLIAQPRYLLLQLATTAGL